MIANHVLGFLRQRKANPALEVGIHEEYFPTAFRERVAQIDGDGRLSDSSLLTDQCKCGHDENFKWC